MLEVFSYLLKSTQLFETETNLTSLTPVTDFTRGEEEFVLRLDQQNITQMSMYYCT